MLTTTVINDGNLSRYWSLIRRTPGLHSGVPHISGKGVTVQCIVSWYKQGLGAKEICDRVGHITLAEVHAALAYYHANIAEIESNLAQRATKAHHLEVLHESSNT